MFNKVGNLLSRCGWSIRPARPGRFRRAAVARWIGSRAAQSTWHKDAIAPPLRID